MEMGLTSRDHRHSERSEKVNCFSSMHRERCQQAFFQVTVCDYCHSFTGHKAKDGSQIGIFIAVRHIILMAQPSLFGPVLGKCVSNLILRLHDLRNLVEINSPLQGYAASANSDMESPTVPSAS
jgi:hypothetical protein